MNIIVYVVVWKRMTPEGSGIIVVLLEWVCPCGKKCVTVGEVLRLPILSIPPSVTVI